MTTDRVTLFRGERSKFHPRNNLPRIPKDQILAAKRFYKKELKDMSNNKAMKAIKNVKGFDWLLEYQTGYSFAEIAFKYKTSQSVVRNAIRSTRGRVLTYIKLKELNRDKSQV